VAPEGMLAGQIYMTGYGNAGFLLGILIATRLSPTLGKLFFGSGIQSTVPEATGARATRPSGGRPQPAPALR
jgi:hypothetical protein